MKKQLDLFRREPEIGDTIVFNPPGYKGLSWGRCVGFSKAGLPKITYGNEGGEQTPKTGFVIIKNLN